MKHFKFLALMIALVTSIGSFSSCSDDNKNNSGPDPDVLVIDQLKGKIWHLWKKAEYENVNGVYVLDEVDDEDEDWKCVTKSDGSAQFCPVDYPSDGFKIPRGATTKWVDSDTHSTPRIYIVTKLTSTEFVVEEEKTDEKKVYYFKKKY